MYWYTGHELKKYVENKLRTVKKERFLFSDVRRYLFNPDTQRTLCLYGLRRTGKTVMALQSLSVMGKYESSLFIACEADPYKEEADTMQTLKKCIAEHPDCKYIVIDEITKMRDFVGTCSYLADAVSSTGKKVIMTGTDSLAFLFAANNELADRMESIHTTYIPFDEYNYLLNKSLDDYIAYGGTLTDGYTMYNEDSHLDYCNVAIAFNIMHSLANIPYRDCSHLEAGLLKKPNLVSIINNVVQQANREFLANSLNRAFVSRDLGSTRDLLVQHSLIDSERLNSKELNERVRIFLNIENPSYLDDLTQEETDYIIDCLVKIDVLLRSKDLTGAPEYVFVQPGLRYAQCASIVDALCTSDEFLEAYSYAEREYIKEKLISDIKGNLLEDIIYVSSAKVGAEKEVAVQKYRSMGREVDLIFIDRSKKICAIGEVKLSRSAEPERQGKHLLNKEFCSEIEKRIGYPIVSRFVVYNGESYYDEKSKLDYLNAEDYLSNLSDSMLKLLDAGSTRITD